MENFSTIVDEVRSRADIVDIISDHVALKKSGNNWKGLCPFHQEKTPSFMVNPQKGIFKCFGCGAGGDALAFLQRINNQSFYEVLTELAGRYGIQINYSNENIDSKNQILEINKIATKFFAENLLTTKAGAEAKEYLNNRGITDETIENFNLGLAPEGWEYLLTHLTRNHKLTVKAIEEAGLILKRQNSDGYYDRFRNRIMIPIHNERGEIIAFGGRTLDKEEKAKYLNSPETAVFSKSNNVYALYQAKESIRNEDSAIIMEGYFDAISAHANGITNVVATLGTALTSGQLRLLGKYTQSKRIIIAFDADLAGGTATDRGIEVIKKTFGGLGGAKILDNMFSKDSAYEINVISIPEDKDPDDYIRNKGTEAFKRLVKNAPLLLDYQIEKILKDNNIETTSGKLKTVKELSVLFAEISSPLVRTEYIKNLSERIGVREDDFLGELTRLKPTKRAQKVSKQEIQEKLSSRKQPKDFIVEAERNLISLFFLKESYWNYISEKLKEEKLSEQNHQLIKDSIEQNIEECKSIDELTQRLFAKLASNIEAMEILSDIQFSLEDKYCLDNQSKVELYIKENIVCIERFKAQSIEKQLKEEYHKVEDDEIRALELQYEVRNTINTRLLAL